MTTRRKMMIALGASALAASFRSLAQTSKTYRVGILFGGQSFTPNFREFGLELRRLGYVEGENVSFIVRTAEGRLERLPALARELVAERVDVIVAPATPQATAARQATDSIPIVFTLVTDPVGSGFVQNLAKPGFNLTGTSQLNQELSAKRLEILKEMFPKIKRVAVIVSDEPQVPLQLAQLLIGANQLGIDLKPIQISGQEAVGNVGKQLKALHIDAMVVADSVANHYNHKLLASFAAQARLPTIYPRDDYIDAGGLIYYGANLGALYRRTAYFVDRILKGAKPSDLPVELPTHYELVINMKTAKALGIKVPQSLLARADRVIE